MTERVNTPKARRVAIKLRKRGSPFWEGRMDAERPATCSDRARVGDQARPKSTVGHPGWMPASQSWSIIFVKTYASLGARNVQ